MADDGPDRRSAGGTGGGWPATTRLGLRPVHDGPAEDGRDDGGTDGGTGGDRIAAVHDAARRTARRPRYLRLLHPADAGELRVVRDRVARWAQQNGLPGDVVVDLQLALGEAVANGVEHAYRDGRSGSVEVELAVRRRRRRTVVAVRVADHGSWRPAPQVNGHRGRGLAMIKRLADAVDVRPGRTGTTVCFEIPVRP